MIHHVVFIYQHLHVCVCKFRATCPLQLWCFRHWSSECSKSQVLLRCPTGKPDHCCRQRFIIWSAHAPEDTLGFVPYSWQAQESTLISSLDLIAVCLCGFYLTFIVILICPKDISTSSQIGKDVQHVGIPRKWKSRVTEWWKSGSQKYVRRMENRKGLADAGCKAIQYNHSKRLLI